LADQRLINLNAALAGIGVVGVSVPNWTDKTTWTIWYNGGKEINALTDAAAGPLVQAFDATPITPDPLDSWDVVTLKVCFKHENDIRVLKGQATITLAQFKAAVRAL